MSNSMGGVAEMTIDEAAIMAVLETVPDPEIPVLTITDFGIVPRDRARPAGVLISPTYTGCPATCRDRAVSFARRSTKPAYEHVDNRASARSRRGRPTGLTPARGRERLRCLRHRPAEPCDATAQCPLCASTDTVEVSRFGATPCKARVASCTSVPRALRALQVPLTASAVPDTQTATQLRSWKPCAAMAGYHSAKLPSLVRQIGFRQRCRSLSAARTAASSMSTPRPGPPGTGQDSRRPASAPPC